MENYDKLVKEYLEQVDSELEKFGFSKQERETLKKKTYLIGTLDQFKNFMYDNSPKDAARIVMYRFMRENIDGHGPEIYVRFIKEMLNT